MKEEIKKILQDYMLTDLPLNYATQRVLDLFAVSQQREQLAAFYEHLNDIDKPLRHGNGYKEADDFIAANCG